MSGLAKGAALAIFLVLPLFMVSEAEASSFNHTVSPLSYFASGVSHIGNLAWTADGTEAASVNITVPTGWTINSVGAGCSSAAGVISCDISDGSSAAYNITNPDAATEAELTTDTITATDNTSASVQSVTLVKINPLKVMDTLVELGRGRGNYIYSSRYGGAKEQGGTTFFPASSVTQMYFLHRIYNIGQYVGLGTEAASSVSLTCNYPNKTLVVYHLADSTTLGNPNWTVAYSFTEIEPSFWRMPYAGLEFTASDYSSGSTFSTECSSLTYSLTRGTVTASSDSVSLTAGSVSPLSVSVDYPSDIALGLGQEEVELTYTITNGNAAGNYDLTDIVFEIEAPAKASWIGVRGEIFGSADERYTRTISKLGKGESVNITLYARFDIPSPTANSTALHSGNWTLRFVPPWELTAYNPDSLEQTGDLGAATFVVDNSSTSEIDDLRNLTISNAIKDAVNNNFEKTRGLLDETVFLITDTLDRVGTAANGTEATLTTTPKERAGGELSNPGISFYINQKIANNAWILVLIVGAILAAVLLKNRKHSPYGYGGAYRPRIQMSLGKSVPAAASNVYRPSVRGARR